MPIVIFNKNQEFDASWCDEVVSVMRPNVLGNPFPIIALHLRDTVIRRYAELLRSSPADSPQHKEIDRLRELHRQGKTIGLVCCCTPLPCHADIIKAEIFADSASGILATDYTFHLYEI